jgi:hypothetical protein
LESRPSKISNTLTGDQQKEAANLKNWQFQHTGEIRGVFVFLEHSFMRPGAHPLRHENDSRRGERPLARVRFSINISDRQVAPTTSVIFETGLIRISSDLVRGKPINGFSNLIV